MWEWEQWTAGTGRTETEAVNKAHGKEDTSLAHVAEEITEKTNIIGDHQIFPSNSVLLLQIIIVFSATDVRNAS
ncbi:hypothetical protein GUJ93_ZPchr0011g27124 [Zizania palustris]|uniref:Uncharacterized protein n=1 Tax=Zizania palustris TaxID=103762 RepID=A0A8J5WIH1_ZIZPA|nr:hypothetical protein GUJ93_ZPchr0011g27124 [Zizania palustris]